MNYAKHASIFCGLVALGVASRLIQEFFPSIPPNFHAISAIAIFAGLYFSRAWVAASVPLAAMLISDQWIGGYEFQVMVVVYASLLLPLVFRTVLRSRTSVARVSVSALACSIVFYVTTNLAVWHCWYEHSSAELIRCYMVALPFLLYAMAGDLAYSLGLLAVYRMAASLRAPEGSRATSILVPKAAA